MRAKLSLVFLPILLIIPTFLSPWYVEPSNNKTFQVCLAAQEKNTEPCREERGETDVQANLSGRSWKGPTPSSRRVGAEGTGN